MRHFELEEKLKNCGAIEIKERILRRYEDGRILGTRPGGFWGELLVIHISFAPDRLLSGLLLMN
jgi:hypothetical protein